MRKKTIEKEQFKLEWYDRIRLAFGILPEDLETNRHLFKTAVHRDEPPAFRAFIDRLINGRIYTFTPIWIKAYKAWVTACGKDKDALKDAFYIPQYGFGDSNDNSPLRDIIMEAILPLIDLDSHFLHCSEKDAYYLAAGGNGCVGKPHSRSRQAALLKYCELCDGGANWYQNIYHVVDYIVPESPAYKLIYGRIP